MFFFRDHVSDLALRRCSLAAQGAWMHVLALMHTSEEYGVLRWPLAEIATTAGVPLKHVRELASKMVLKGSDSFSEQFRHVPTHAGQDGEPVLLVQGNGTSCWFCARMVRDNWRKGQRGRGSRFTPDNQPKRTPTRSPTRRTGGGLAFAVAASIDRSTRTDGSVGESEALARALRDEGYPECSGRHPDLVTAATEGITPQELVDAARAKPGKSIGYLVQRARGKRADAADRASTGSSTVTEIPTPDPEAAARAAAERDREDKILKAYNDHRLGLLDDEQLASKLEELGAKPQGAARRAAS